ncbi:MAG: MBOAT family protein, partial [Acidocella sp.]|nr:MBOAT family protein [Acidocella sp.]
MLFNSKLFILGFLPLALLGFRLSGRFARVWVLACSLVFYAWWRPAMVGLLAGSVLVNYTLGRVVPERQGWLVAGLAFNLGLLGFFKYAGLFFGITGIALPLGISFFTFQQIMFLVDRASAALAPVGLLDYACFVGFFPHLIAGPIVRPGDIIPQFKALRPGPQFWRNVAAGGEIFALGLAKKLVLADGLARFADPGFAAAAMGARLSLIEAWVALLAYALQIYFDFSGYSDMAIGLAGMFGIRFPLNFNSPYQARDIGAFWRRWNISLSQFLRDYLYIKLGGNRAGETRRVRNLMVTMLLGGLWHGAAWKFVLWGGLHGVYLVIYGWWERFGVRLPAKLAQATTLLAVCLAWVPFRAANFTAALV